MKKHFSCWMRMVSACVVGCMTVVSMHAVPAYPGWQTKTQPDGSKIEVRQIGDEFYHYWETRDGKIALQQSDGMFVKTAKSVPTKEEIRLRRAEAMTRHELPNVGSGIKKAVSGSTDLPPRGVVILVSYSDSSMQKQNTHEVFDNLCNATNCTTNVYNSKNYGSAAQFYADQSQGAYRPQFDVIGPVTLPHELAYYGEEGEIGGSEQHDMYIADFVIDAVLAADSIGCDFSQYDSNNDGLVDFVYFIFAGRGQAYGGGSETIWPHNWSLVGGLYYGFTHGTSGYYYTRDSVNLLELDGKIINKYACSSELDGYDELGGIGTLCHEFGHVMGLMDLYDIEYGEVYNRGLTPNGWNIMDGGSYNGNMHCPPNYDPWQKYFFGWVIPENLGEEASNNVLHPNGTDEYNNYQVNYFGTQRGALTSGLNYYLEYRQQKGWDEFVPAEGLVVWRVDYDQQVWDKNAPNASSTPDAPRHTYVSIGEGDWDDVIGKPVTDVIEKDGVVHFKYKGGIDGAYPETPAPIWDGWVYFDDGQPVGHYNFLPEVPYFWGIKLPAGTLVHNMLTKISVYETTAENTQPITIDIYSGGTKPLPENKIYTETVDPAGEDGFHEITLAHPVLFNQHKNLWIILSEGSDVHPAMYCAKNDDSYGCWRSKDGYIWYDDLTSLLPGTFMLRALIEPDPNPAIVTKEVKLVPNLWAIDDAAFAAWVWNNADIPGEWAVFEGKSDTLTALVNEKATDILFFRFDPSKGLKWSAEWNRTKDEKIDWESGVYTITAWGEDGVSEGTWEPNSEGLEDMTSPTKANKILLNGQLYILRDKKVYTVFGQQADFGR